MPPLCFRPFRGQQAQTSPAPLPVRVGMTDWNLGQRGDITKVALAREIGLDGIQVSVQYPTDGKTPTLRDAEDAGRIQAGGARQRHPDLLARDRHPGKVAAADAHQSGRSRFCSSRRSRSRTTSAPTTSCCRSSATATST